VDPTLAAAVIVAEHTLYRAISSVHDASRAVGGLAPALPEAKVALRTLRRVRRRLRAILSDLEGSVSAAISQAEAGPGQTEEGQFTAF
jgi:hypothetical protein